MASYITDALLKTKVASILKVDEASLPPYWDDVIAQANTSAYQDVLGILTARGFTQAQIAQWDRGPEYQQSIGLFWALSMGGALGDYGDGYQSLDRRKELQTVMMMINGIWQQPGGVPGGTELPFEPIGIGQQTTGQDMFGLDPTDPRIGQPTEW